VAATERLDPLMGFLGIVSALLAAFDLADPGLSPASQRALLIATGVSWAVFIVDIAGTAPRRAFPPARASLAAIGSPC
jgi:hypothetical protein